MEGFLKKSNFKFNFRFFLYSNLVPLALETNALSIRPRRQVAGREKKNYDVFNQYIPRNKLNPHLK